MIWSRRTAAALARVEPVLPPPAARASRRVATGYTDLASAEAVPSEKTWNIARPMPGVLPSGQSGMASDDAFSSLYSFLGGVPFNEGARWLGYPILAELSQRPEYRRISETLAKEMTRKWIKLRSTSDDDKRDKLRVLDQALDRHRVRQHFRRLTEIDGFFGSAKLYIDTGVSHDPDELAAPLARNAAKIGRGSLRRLRVIEPMWTYPADYNSFDPLARGFYTPAAWYVQGKRIHGSRLLHFCAREVPDLLKPAYAFGGISMSQIAMPYVENWIRARQSVSDLLHSFSVNGLKTNMQAAETEDGELTRRVRLFNAYRDNKNLLVIDKDTEEFFNVSAPLGTVDKLLAQAQEQMASVAGIPLVVLLGITPSGLNASSEGEIQAWRAWVRANQEQFYTDNLQAVIEIVQLSEFGAVDPEISFEYEPLDDVDEAERATVRKTNADTFAVYADHGVLAPREERERLAADETSVYTGLDVDDLPPVPDMTGAGPPEDDAATPSPGAEPALAAPADDDAPARPDVVVPLRRFVGERLAADKEWHESDHPRGQPDNAGQFGPGGAGGQTPGPTRPTNGQTQGKTAASASTPASLPSASGAPPSSAKAALQLTRMQGTTRVQADGSPLPAHITALKVPPGWADVRFNPDPAAALLATGKDAKGRPTAIYSEAFSAAQAAEKFARVSALARQMDAITAKNDAARRSDDARTRNTADCLDLVMKMGIRPGSETDTGAKVQAYGATTLQGRHVVRTPDGVRLRFTGKKGVALDLAVSDPDLAGRLLARAKNAGPDGKLFGGVSDAALLAHVKTVAGDKFKTKDLRTNLGTKTASDLVKLGKPPTNAKQYKIAVNEVAKAVSAKLGNTPAIALQSYVNPVVFADWRASAGI